MIVETEVPEKPLIDLTDKIQTLDRPNLKSAAAPKDGDTKDPIDSEEEE